MPIIRPPARRVGLNVCQKPPPLLSTIKGRPTRPSESSPSGPGDQSKMSASLKLKEPEAITAPPLSSDSEDDYPPLRPMPGNSSQDSDNDDENRRGDIKPTVFSGAQSSPPQSSNARGGTRAELKSSSQGDRRIRGSQNDEPSSSAGSKRSAQDAVPESDTHLKDKLGFTGTAFKRNKISKRRSLIYGSKSSQPRSSQSKSSQSKSSQKTRPGTSTPQSDAEPTAKKFRHFEPSPSPESLRSPPARRFLKPESLSPEGATLPTGFVMPPSSVGSSPHRGKSRPVFQHITLSDDSPKLPKFKSLDPDRGRSSSAPKADTGVRKPSRTGKPRKPKAKAGQTAPEPGREADFSQRPTFKLHALDDIDYPDESNDKNANTSENKASDDEIGEISILEPVAVTARCPMCREVVDAKLLAKHSDDGRMNIRKQAAFCRLHKRKTALRSRAEKGYPKIDWGALNSRLGSHHDFLKDVLEGTRPSHYGNLLRRNVESGKNRTLLRTEDSLTPGYYGPRGLRVMTEYIMRALSSTVRKRAVEDRLVSARGYTGYVQAVLVPELAVRLIMEDMKVGEGEARAIMQDSIEFGELLYEDAGDAIAGVSDEEDGP
ncbi:hypothetical protein GGS23DRAFT_111532 [Durotheca rogersii]|uniref:uncharacterized protein n=1 Tax=Durotheca rogersii TaxID=419775 RepID=UPI0022207EB5|nr:uncharacterized protein GGS23DRAFT_111532 [Durotheca rogersii]KAI5862211.1 hypothetical protein GGS23DRAFT_111532 [Durotheca rogersii]